MFHYPVGYVIIPKSPYPLCPSLYHDFNGTYYWDNYTNDNQRYPLIL